MKMLGNIILPLTAFSLLTASGQAPAPVTEDIGVAHDNASHLSWTVYRPSGTADKPVILVIHAGGFKAGSKNDPGVVSTAQDLAARGFIACAINFRLDQDGPPWQMTKAYAHLQSQTEQQIQDVRQAILFARNPGLLADGTTYSVL